MPAKKKTAPKDPLERIEALLTKTLIVQMYLNGMSMGDIAQNMHIRKDTVVEMLKGIKKPN